ncbi:MAG: class I SAM-dependent methyltransferase [Phascolarctobacterium sp.]|nr:class I SAM-dependent methyltransferase [Phascolarctobacterium sp.]
MHLDKRLQAVASLVPQGSRLADIGTDHAYLPVWLVRNGAIASAVAGDIASGPCQAARATVAMYATADKIAVRQGSGLAVLAPGEADCIAICGMGGSTIISILAADMAVATSAQRLVLQPMAGAATLRRWLVEQGWSLVSEALVDDAPHFYEIICAERSSDAASYSEAEYLVGPALIRDGHPLLAKQIARQQASLEELLSNMARSERAKASAKYQEAQRLVQELAELKHRCK